MPRSQSTITLPQPDRTGVAKAPDQCEALAMVEYRDATFALLTQHGKEQVIAPLFAERFSARIQRVQGFDTDSLGTFTGDVPRAGSQLEAARKKARLGMDLSGLPFGIGSEGSFAPAFLGLSSMNLELVVLLDAVEGHELVGRAQAVGRHSHATVTTREELEQAATRLGFPEHGLVLRPTDEHDPRLHKGLCTGAVLHEAFETARSLSPRGAVFVENDLRAHFNPTRMMTIRAATQELLLRMQSRCGRCDAPGFGLLERLPGLQCRDCGFPTQVARAERFTCVACTHDEVRELAIEHADPSRCDRCNP